MFVQRKEGERVGEGRGGEGNRERLELFKLKLLTFITLDLHEIFTMISTYKNALKEKVICI